MHTKTCYVCEIAAVSYQKFTSKKRRENMYVIQTTAISIAIEWYCKPLPINFSRIRLFKNMVLVRCFQTFRSNLTRPYLKYCKPFWQLKLTFTKVGYKSTGKLASESKRLARRTIFTVELRLMCRVKVLVMLYLDVNSTNICLF